MTVIFCTIGDGFGLLSQDTLCSQVADKDIGKPAAGHFFNAAPAFYGDKLGIFPARGIIAAGSGHMAPVFMSYTWIRSCPNLCSCLDLAKTAPYALAEIHRLTRRVPFAITALGLSDGKVCGFQFDSDEGFKPTPIAPGHGCAPPLDESAPDYGEIAPRLEPALTGDGAEELHALFARNVERAAAKGHYGTPTTAVGGRLFSARITKEGITVRQSYSFAKHAEHGARAAAEREAPEGAIITLPRPRSCLAGPGRARAAFHRA